jgi:hypothetical protein
MADSSVPNIENVKVLSNNERTSGTNRVITSSDAMRSGLPANCIVMPMQVLVPPEPIKKHKKKR